MPGETITANLKLSQVPNTYVHEMDTGQRVKLVLVIKDKKL